MKFNAFSDEEKLFGLAMLAFAVACFLDATVAILAFADWRPCEPAVLIPFSRILLILGTLIYFLTLAALGSMKDMLLGLFVPISSMGLFWLGSRMVEHLNDGRLPRVVPELVRQQYFTVAATGALLLCVYNIRRMEADIAS